MKRIKSLLSVFVLTLAATACAGNSGENKKSNEPTKEDNKMEVVALNKADFLKKVYNYEANPNDWKFEGSRPAIVDFYATWCGPCRMVGPVLEEIAEEHSDIKVGKINVDEEQELAAQFQIMSIPTLMVVKDGKITEKTMGARPKAQILSML